MSPKSAYKGPAFKSHELRPGKIIGRPHQDSFTELFTIVGTSHTDVALVRIFEDKDINVVLANKCTRILHTMTGSVPTGLLNLPLYADVTKLFYQQSETLLLLLSNTTLLVVGKLHKKDLSDTRDALLKCNTISLHEKTAFLTF